MKLEYIFFLKFSFGYCCYFVLASLVELITVSRLDKSLIHLSNQFSKVSRLIIASVRSQSGMVLKNCVQRGGCVTALDRFSKDNIGFS